MDATIATSSRLPILVNPNLATNLNPTKNMAKKVKTVETATTFTAPDDSEELMKDPLLGNGFAEELYSPSQAEKKDASGIIYVELS